MTTLRFTAAPPLETWPEQACTGADPRIFFPKKEGGGPASHEAAAKALCRKCPAREHCKAYAMPIQDLTGIWGGLNANERTRARKKQQKEA